jgi:hypothetical protein
MMINNATIINKTAETLSRQTIDHTQKTRHMAMYIQVLTWCL